MCVNCNLLLPIKPELIDKIGLPKPPDPHDLLISVRSCIDIIISQIRNNFSDNEISKKLAHTIIPYLESLHIKLFYIPAEISDIDQVKKLLILSDFDDVFEINLQECNFWNEQTWEWKIHDQFLSPAGHQIACGKLSRKKSGGQLRLDIGPDYPKHLICMESSIIMQAVVALSPETIIKNDYNSIKPYLKMKSEKSTPEIWNAVIKNHPNTQIIQGTVKDIY